jgi:ornithine decarboxylase
MTFDDESEIGKMAAAVPGADVLVRVSVRNNRALVDLNTKFGAPLEEALPLLRKAKAAGLNPAGICFHVGSQSLSTAAYEEALLVCRGLFDEARAMGIKAGLIRPITLWPFPKAPFKKAAEHAKAMISVELSMGQMIEDVQLATECRVPVTLCNRAGGMIPSPEQVLEAIKEADKNGGAK